MNTNPIPSTIELLQQLIRFNTTNPPGYEAGLIAYVDELLQSAGIATTICAKDEIRPNLIARLRGQGTAPPLLLYGHVDVVTTADQNWTIPPFTGAIKDGFIWGRGALDMKNGVAMFLSAFLRAAENDQPPPGDLILALLADEEVDGEFGARYLVEEHPDLFSGVHYAIGEGGGYSVTLAGQKYYPIMVAEKQICSLHGTIHGRGGHGSMPIRGGTMGRLGQVLQALDQKRLPVHITPVVRDMVQIIAEELPFPLGQAFRQILQPAFTGKILDALGDDGRLIAPLLHHTVSPTILRGGHKINVIPSEITLELDGRLLPGFQPEDLLRELFQLLGPGVSLKVSRYDPGPKTTEKRIYDYFAAVLREADPQGIPIPYLLSGVTDGRYFGRLGIQTIGFLPMDLPSGLIETIHDADERAPVSAVQFGTDVIFKSIMGFQG